jgi:hypothetical protein
MFEYIFSRLPLIVEASLRVCACVYVSALDAENVAIN